ncbi:PREDICTED: probable LRR receptor-like serine/threonine-protein kinase At1g51880, partial [Tarenaya hassleriana]|uniref:probable LRR receptor-like serine/threonine-protein kinase At1g51880 n=1 Tax=Tarenaya hassleriana TaxID=28532 RepID=UPI00053C16D3
VRRRIHQFLKQYEDRNPRQYHNLRSFPQGRRNCYCLDVKNGSRYMIRTSFLYGNYDGLNQTPSFDLHVGPNKYASVKIQDPQELMRKELIHVPTSQLLQLCLVKTGPTHPFISALELRPLHHDTYIPESDTGSLLSLFRYYLASINSQGLLRHDTDIVDRIWEPFFREDWTEISTDVNITGDTEGFDLPQAVMRTAGAPRNASEPLVVEWSVDNSSGDSPEFICMHFAEIEALKPNETREFDITFNGGDLWFERPFSPANFTAKTIQRTEGSKCDEGFCRFELVKTQRSSRPPILNAIEAYTIIDLPLLETEEFEGRAMREIEKLYGMERRSWEGDPCFPPDLSWEGLKCYYPLNQPRTITSLNLSSSGLTGNITSYISDLSHLTELDLSNNNLTGEVPQSLWEMKSLTILDLSNNKLSGTVPKAIFQRRGLRLKYEGNPSLCAQDSVSFFKNSHSQSVFSNECRIRNKEIFLKIYMHLLRFSFVLTNIYKTTHNLTAKIKTAFTNFLFHVTTSSIFTFPCTCLSHFLTDSCRRGKTKIIVPVVASLGSLAFIFSVLACLFLIRRKAASNADTKSGTDTSLMPSDHSSLLTKERRFTYSQVLKMTNNFERVLGKGGFGDVYHGCLNNTEQVAVKLLSESSVQGFKQFKAEVELLLRVHHKNLVNLVGYCDEGNKLALIYEYMENGNLKEHLSGKRGDNILTWASRLKIAAEAAQGLEYLHNGCKPQIVHRDVKPANILLDEHFRGKLADFGLSRSFPVDGDSHVSTSVAGTPGYFDPEYYKTNWLTEKSHVYSFGVVLLEIITNRPVFDQSREKHYIVEWVGETLEKGDIHSIVDPKLQGQFENNSAWKTVEVAMSCVNHSANRRPTMSRVVADLNSCVAMEMARTGDSLESSTLELSLGFGTQLAAQPHVR